MANSYGTATKLGNVNSISNATYSAQIGSTIDLGAAPPHELLLSLVGVTPNTSATAAATMTLFVSGSLDNTNFTDAPADVNTAANARFVGALTFTANTAARSSGQCSVAAAFGGALPRYIKVYVYNGSGAATSSGTGTGVNEVWYQTETFG